MGKLLYFCRFCGEILSESKEHTCYPMFFYVHDILKNVEEVTAWQYQCCALVYDSRSTASCCCHEGSCDVERYQEKGDTQYFSDKISLAISKLESLECDVDESLIEVAISNEVFWKKIESLASDTSMEQLSFLEKGVTQTYLWDEIKVALTQLTLTSSTDSL